MTERKSGRATRHPLPREVDLDAIANALTRAQHGYLGDDPRKRGGAQAASRKALKSRGLVEQRGRVVRPTPLGRRVQALLRDRERGVE